MLVLRDGDGLWCDEEGSGAVSRTVSAQYCPNALQGAKRPVVVCFLSVC